MGRRVTLILPALAAGIAGITVAVALNLSGARVHAQNCCGHSP
jgi:hypothetical protein